MKKTIDVTFKNIQDFKNRIVALWCNQKDDEIYQFHFVDKETEECFNDLVKTFDKEGQQGARS